MNLIITPAFAIDRDIRVAARQTSQLPANLILEKEKILTIVNTYKHAYRSTNISNKFKNHCNQLKLTRKNTRAQ